MKREHAKSLLRKTKEDYNLIAKEFSRTRNYPWQELRFLFDAYLGKSERILDLGCGNGRYIPFFEKQKSDYFGIDNSTELIQIARKKYPKAQFFTEDALSLSFPNNYFDKIYSIALLHQIPSEEFRLQLLKEAKRVLRLKGLLILTVWKFHRRQELILLLKYTLLKIFGKSKMDWRDIFVSWGRETERYYHFFSKRELENLIKKAGLEVIDSGIVKNRNGNRRNIYVVAKKP